MVWFTNAIQVNIRRETYTSQLMKGERCTIERPLFISSANFQLINICLHRIKKVRIHLHTLTSQQKIHWYRVEYITLFCNGFTDARATPKNSVNLIPWVQKWLLYSKAKPRLTVFSTNFDATSLTPFRLQRSRSLRCEKHSIQSAEKSKINDNTYMSLYLSWIEGSPPKRNAPGSNPGRDILLRNAKVIFPCERRSSHFSFWTYHQN